MLACFGNRLMVLVQCTQGNYCIGDSKQGDNAAVDKGAGPDRTSLFKEETRDQSRKRKDENYAPQQDASQTGACTAYYWEQLVAGGKKDAIVQHAQNKEPKGRADKTQGSVQYFALSTNTSGHIQTQTAHQEENEIERQIPGPNAPFDRCESADAEYPEAIIDLEKVVDKYQHSVGGCKG